MSEKLTGNITGDDIVGFISGDKGDPGVGIKEVEWSPGEDTNVLRIKLTNGRDYAFDVHNGKDGADGKDGKDGLDGKDGNNGQDGSNGKDGADGKDGVGMPAVTDADEGKIASVVGGKWATITIEELAEKIKALIPDSGGDTGGDTGGEDTGGENTGGGDGTGDDGGDEPLTGYDYTGSVTVSDKTALELNISGLSAINNNGIYLEGGKGGDYVVTKIENGVVYYEDSGDIVSDGEIATEFIRGLQGEYTGIKVSADAQNVDLVFDGTYTWGYKE